MAAALGLYTVPISLFLLAAILQYMSKNINRSYDLDYFFTITSIAAVFTGVIFLWALVSEDWNANKRLIEGFVGAFMITFAYAALNTTWIKAIEDKLKARIG